MWLLLVQVSAMTPPPRETSFLFLPHLFWDAAVFHSFYSGWVGVPLTAAHQTLEMAVLHAEH